MTRSGGSTNGSGLGLGFFDDDDLAERARRAGFELAVAHDLFVHHFGSRTFVGTGVDAARLLDENAARFAVKWGDSVPRGVRVGLRAFSAGALTPALSQRERGSEGCDGARLSGHTQCDDDGPGLSAHTQCVSDSTGLSGLHPPRPPLCKVRSQSARDSLAQGAGDSAGLSGPHPPGPPFARWGARVRGIRLPLALATALVYPASTPPAPPLQGGEPECAGFDCAGRWRQHWFIRPPPPPAPPLQGREPECAGFACAGRWRQRWFIRPPPPPAPPLQRSSSF